MRIASIQFHVVYVPGSKCNGIYIQVAQYTWIAGTSVVTIIFVDAKLEALRMYLRQDKDIFFIKYFGVKYKIL